MSGDIYIYIFSIHSASDDLRVLIKTDKYTTHNLILIGNIPYRKFQYELLISLYYIC